MSAKINIPRKSIQWVLMGRELKFGESNETQYPCLGLLIATHPLIMLENKETAQIPLMAWKLDPVPMWLHLQVKWDQNDLTCMHQPISEYRGSTGGVYTLSKHDHHFKKKKV